ncbi:MAG: hypothetical protein ACK452_09220 [Bacteroidota bacterium]|jgi:hypothetical protein
MKDFFSVRFFSRSGLIICFGILVVNLVAFFYLPIESQSSFTYSTHKPSMGISLICALGTFLMTILIMFHKHKLVIGISILTLFVLGYLKFIVLA